MQNPNAPYQSVDTATTIPVSQPVYQEPYQGQTQPGMYQQPMMVPQQGTYQPPMAQPVAQPVVAAPVYGQPLSQPVVMPPTYGDGAYERNRELQRRKLWIGIGIIVGIIVVGNIISYLCGGYIFIVW